MRMAARRNLVIFTECFRERVVCLRMENVRSLGGSKRNYSCIKLNPDSSEKNTVTQQKAPSIGYNVGNSHSLLGIFFFFTGRIVQHWNWCPESLWDLQPWRYPNLDWMRPWTNMASAGPPLGQMTCRGPFQPDSVILNQILQLAMEGPWLSCLGMGQCESLTHG